MTTLHCPALLIAAPGSGTGKTTFTAGLARYHRNQGRRVCIFKLGPDFLDPMILEQACGAPVYNLDLWMGGEAHAQALLYAAAQASDLILIESAMGLFDGQPSAADVAQHFNIPVLGLLNAKGQAQTFGALAFGLAHYRAGLAFAGIAANQIGSAHHSQLLAESMPAGLAYLGGLPRDNTLSLPERHLGLTLASEIADLDERIERCAALIADTHLKQLPAPASFTSPDNISDTPPSHLQGMRIAIAKDAAFAFIYRANLELLQQLGATLHFFSPLADNALPECDALYLPGGYPELHTQALAANHHMHTAIRAHFAAEKPIYAECGGMLYLLEHLQTLQQETTPMLGLLPGSATMQQKLAALGLQALQHKDEEIRGHTFHYSTANITLTPWTHARRQRGSASGEAIYRHGSITASYLHLYFPSHPPIAASFFKPSTTVTFVTQRMG